MSAVVSAMIGWWGGGGGSIGCKGNVVVLVGGIIPVYQSYLEVCVMEGGGRGLVVCYLSEGWM